MFTPHNSTHGAVAPWEYLPAKAGEYQAGQLLTVADGQLKAVDADSASTPGYLCMANISAEEGVAVPVTRIQSEYVYETALSKEAEVNIGDKLQVTAGGLQVNADAAGTFEVTYVDGTAAGAMVRGRFV